MSKLKNRILIKRGGNLPSELYSFSGNYLRLTLANFYETGGFKKSNLSRNVYFTGDTKKYIPLEKNALITPLTEQVKGLLGSMALIPESNKYIPCGDIGIIEILDKNIDKSYFYHLFKYDYIRTQLVRGAQKSKIRHISASDFYNIEWDFPELKIQKKIGEFLDKIDNKIELNNKINSELENIAKTIYDYWFLQFEFPNDEGKPYKSSGGKMIWNEELKKEIPDRWKIGKIGDLFKSQSGYAFKSSNWKEKGHPVLTIKNILLNGDIDMNNSSYIEKYTENLEKYTVSNGNMIFAMSGNTIGKIGIIASKIENILINQRVLIIKTQSNNMAYLYFTLINKNIQNKIYKLGSNSAQPNISDEELKNIKICMSTSDILEQYNLKCKKIFEKIIQNRIENQELTSLRDYLLPLLMNGQVGFKD